MKGELPGLMRHLLFGHFCAKSIKKGLTKSLGQPPLSLDKDEQTAVLQSIAWKAGELLVSDHARALDPPSRGHLEWSSWILAAFDVLRSRFDDEQSAIEYLGDVSLEAFDTRSLRTGIAMLLKRCAGDLDKVQSLYSAAMTQYGATFSWHVDTTQDSVTLQVDRCFYYDFFAAHGHPGLTTVLCRLDQLWFDRIDPEKHKLRFNRDGYETLSRGASACTFPIVDVTVSASSA